MATFFLALVIIAVALIGLGLGTLLGRPPLAAGCGRQACSGCERARRDSCKRRQEAAR
jgi:hypothetical protein